MMHIIFMGTPDFAVPALGAVLAAGHEVVAVYTQPPRAAGRGLAARKSPVQLFAESRGLAVHTPGSLKSAEEQARFKSLNADAGVVVGLWADPAEGDPRSATLWLLQHSCLASAALAGCGAHPARSSRRRCRDRRGGHAHRGEA